MRDIDCERARRVAEPAVRGCAAAAVDARVQDGQLRGNRVETVCGFRMRRDAR